MPFMREPVIQLKNVSLVYDRGKSNEVRALQDASMEIFRGEFVAIFGPSGCGKSTLLYTIAGIERPTSGEVRVFDMGLGAMNSKTLALFRKLKIGFVFQAFHLIPTFTILTNVVLPQIFANIPQRIREKRAKKLLERFGVLAQAHKYPTELSGGQQQRVAVARSLMNNPELILADEPVGNLDSASAETIMNILSDLAEKEGRTVVLVTHDPLHLRRAHRVFWMKDGRIVRVVEQAGAVQSGKPGSLLLERYAQRFPYTTEMPLKARALTGHLYDGYDPDIQQRIEHEIANIIAGRISYEQFTAFLDCPFKDGGAGLYRPSAERFSARLRQILEAAERLARIRRVAQDIPILLRNELASLVGSVIGEGARFSGEQKELIMAEAGKRVLGQVSAEEFFSFLDRSQREGGAGLDERVARRIFWDVEVLLLEYAQQ